MNREAFEIEICAANIQSVLAAQKGGADRVELCDNLYEGGTTPSMGTLIMAKEKTDIDVFVMIRPRGGDFLYTDDEFQIMVKDVELAQKFGADGIVFGCLNANGTINTDQCKKLIDSAKGLPVTFHRAFDVCIEPLQAIEVLKSLGINRILTSGQQNKAIDGIPFIREIVSLCTDELKVMVGSGVNEQNILAIAEETKARAFHFTLREEIASAMQFKKSDIHMRGMPEIPEYLHKISSSKRIQTVIAQLHAL